MNRKHTSLTAAAALILAAASGTALAQYQNVPARQSLQLAQRLGQMQTSLADAMKSAEKHTNGVAIGIRVSTSRELFGSPSEDGRAYGTQDWEPTLWADEHQDATHTRRQDTDRQRETANRTGDRQNANQSGQREQWDRNQSGYSSSDALYAIVTCIVDRAKVREVVVDLRDNSIVGVQSLHAFEQNRDVYAGNDRYDRDRGDQRWLVDQSSPNLARASDIMNATVRNPSGDKLGNIDELAIDPDNNRVVYAVLRRGGFLGMGESRYAIASSDVGIPRDGRMMLNLNNRDFENTNGFDNSNWPTRANPEWNTTWTNQSENAPTARRVIKASDIIGTNVQCSDGKKFASISDLIVEPQTGRILYAILDSDRGNMPVPMSTLRKQGDIYSLPMNAQQLNTKPAFDYRNDPNWTDARWNRRIHESYGVQLDSSWNTQRQQETQRQQDAQRRENR